MRTQFEFARTTAGLAAGIFATLIVGVPPAHAATAHAAAIHPAAAASTVYSFGSNSLGDGSQFGDQPTPAQVAALAGIAAVQVATSELTVLVLSSTGQIYSWGDNLNGALGNGNDEDNYTPEPIALPAGTARVVKVAAGDTYSMALTSTGQVLTWGQKQDLGDGSAADRYQPAPIALPGARTAVDISAGFAPTVATNDGKVFGWGSNRYGQLGNGHIGGIASRPIKALTPAGFKATSVAAGSFHELALGTLNGKKTVLAWGDNSRGELGTGLTSSKPQLTPVQTHFPSGSAPISTIYASTDYGSGALTSTGVLYRWGSGDSGAIGNGTDNVDALLPTTPSLPAGTVVTSASVGGSDTLVLTSTNKVYGWGDNVYGALGPSTAIEDVTPIRISMPAGTITGVSEKEFTSFVIIRPV